MRLTTKRHEYLNFPFNAYFRVFYKFFFSFTKHLWNSCLPICTPEGSVMAPSWRRRYFIWDRQSIKSLSHFSPCEYSQGSFMAPSWRRRYIFETGNPLNPYRSFFHVNIVTELHNSFALDPLFPATNLSYRRWRFNWYWYLNSTFLIDQRFKSYHPAKPRSIGWPDEKQKLAKSMRTTSFRSCKVGQLLMIFAVFF